MWTRPNRPHESLLGSGVKVYAAPAGVCAPAPGSSVSSSLPVLATSSRTLAAGSRTVTPHHNTTALNTASSGKLTVVVMMPAPPPKLPSAEMTPRPTS